MPPGESLRFPLPLAAGKREVGRTQGQEKRKDEERRDQGQEGEAKGCTRSFLTPPERSVGDQEKEDNESESQCFLRLGPQAHGPLPTRTSLPCPGREHRKGPLPAKSQDSLWNLRMGTTSFLPTALSSKSQKVNDTS